MMKLNQIKNKKMRQIRTILRDGDLKEKTDKLIYIGNQARKYYFSVDNVTESTLSYVNRQWGDNWTELIEDLYKNNSNEFEQWCLNNNWSTEELYFSDILA